MYEAIENLLKKFPRRGLSESSAKSSCISQSEIIEVLSCQERVNADRVDDGHGKV